MRQKHILEFLYAGVALSQTDAMLQLVTLIRIISQQTSLPVVLTALRRPFLVLHFHPPCTMVPMFAAALSPSLVGDLLILTIIFYSRKALDHGKTVQGTYAYKSSALANTTNGVLADELFDQLNDQEGADFIFPVRFRL
ncbi:hypothetical protein VKT23_008671 [Stygiomarasmius scandens]|uniref:Uncharacterized protein n=1 Tax=Marasmiellus scandens TaxID=2682957 RepID=A0ABR1JHX4_9AGAR